MSDQPLPGIKVKLERAQEQFHGLKALVQTYRSSKPYTIRRYMNTAVGECWADVRIKKSIPVVWGVLIGELIHNFRSALDHLVWELVILETGAPPVANKTQFPVFLTEAGFNNKRRGENFLHGVGTEAKAIIKSLQPYSTGEGEDSPLWHLHELSNWDKHRTIYLTQALTESVSIEAPGNLIKGLFAFPTGPLEDGTVLGGVQFIDRPEIPFVDWIGQVDVKFHFTTHIGFKHPPLLEGQNIEPTLAAMGSRVIAIVNRVYEEIFEKSGHG